MASRPIQKRWVRRALIGVLALTATTKGLRDLEPHQITPKTITEKKSTLTQPENRTVERVARSLPAFVERIRRENMNRGTMDQIETNWTQLAREAQAEYQARIRTTGHRFIPAPMHEVDSSVRVAEHTTHVPAGLLKAIMRKESMYDPLVVSTALAMGPMQLKPDALAELVRIGHPVNNPFDLGESTIGAGHLFQHYTQRSREITLRKGNEFVTRERVYFYARRSQSFDRLPRDVQQRIVLRTYNAGPGILGDFKRRDGSYDTERLINQHYPQDIMAFYAQNQ